MQSGKVTADQKDAPRIDIIMATYNGERYITEQIDSIFAQTYSNWRLIIRDDGSTDKTVDIIKKYAKKDSRIQLIEDAIGNLGFNKNFLTLLNSTSADYISICDQDDVWLPQKLALCLEKLQHIETPAKLPALVHCDASVVNSSLEMISDRWIGERGKVTGVHGLVFANSVQGAATIINVSLKKIALELTPEIPYDYHLALLSVFKGKRFYIDQPLLKYRQHSNNAIGAMGTNEQFNMIYYSKQLIDLMRSMLHYLRYDRLTLSLKFGLSAYHKIKKTYAKEPIPTHLNQAVQEYLYLFEGDSRLHKLYYYIKQPYAFSRKKDYWTCLFLIAIGRDLRHPELWK